MIGFSGQSDRMQHDSGFLALGICFSIWQVRQARPYALETGKLAISRSGR